MSLNVLLVTHQFLPKYAAGTEILTLELARGLREKGCSVQILTGEPDYNAEFKTQPRITTDDYDGFTVHRLHYGVTQCPNPTLSHINVPERIELVTDLVNNLKPDIVHFNHFMGFSSGVIPAVRETGVPVLFTPTDYWAVCPQIILMKSFNNQLCDGPADGIDCFRCLRKVPGIAAKCAMAISQSPVGKVNPRINGLRLLKERHKRIAEDINAANVVLPATKFLAEILVRHGVKRQLIKVVPYGVNIGGLPEKIEVPDQFNPNNPLRLGFIGRVSELKGLHVVLDALGQLGDKKNNVVLDIYGKIDNNDPYGSTIIEKADKLGSSVKLKGTFPHDKIGEVLRSFHLSIVPSIWYEDTPLVLCSSLSAGIPAIVSRVGGMTEVIEDGINGFTFKTGDPRSLSKVMDKILTQKELLVKMMKTNSFRERSTVHYAEETRNEYMKLLASE